MALLRIVHRISADCVRGPGRRIRRAAIWVREARARNSVLEKPSGSSREEGVDFKERTYLTLFPYVLFGVLKLFIFFVTASATHTSMASCSI